VKTTAFAIAATAAVLALSGCTTPTPYQAAVDTGGGYHPGYTDTKLEDTRYRITFAGNDVTSRETVENYLLYHAADLTLQQGYDWFEVVKRASDEKTRQVTTVDDPFWGGMSWRYYRRGWGGWGGWGPGPFDADTTDFSRYEASAEIILHKGQKTDAPNAYDARQIKANLQSKVVLPGAAK
jgi:hypothetical protein